MPPASLRRGSRRRRAARRYGWPCQGPDMPMLRGIVHDPTARRMGGVAGHAGLFSTAADLAIFCRMLLDGGALQRRPDPVAAGGREDDNAVDAAGRAERPRPRLGHRFLVLVQPRRAAADRLVRPHRVHRHVALDRSGDRDVRRVPVEPRASRTARETSRRCARAWRHGRGRSITGVPADMRSRTVSPDAISARRDRAPPAPPPDAGADRHRRAAGEGLRAAARQARRARHQPHRPRPRRRDHDRSAARREGRQARRALQPGARHPRHSRREGAVGDGREDRPADPLALRRDPPADRPRCSRASTRWSSTSRTSAPASTPTSRRWRT